MIRDLTPGEIDEVAHAFEHMDVRTGQFIAERGIKPTDSYAIAAKCVRERHAEIVALLREHFQ